jgi:hypothetical protein
MMLLGMLGFNSTVKLNFYTQSQSVLDGMIDRPAIEH